MSEFIYCISKNTFDGEYDRSDTIFSFISEELAIKKIAELIELDKSYLEAYKDFTQKYILICGDKSLFQEEKNSKVKELKFSIQKATGHLVDSWHPGTITYFVEKIPFVDNRVLLKLESTHDDGEGIFTCVDACSFDVTLLLAKKKELEQKVKDINNTVKECDKRNVKFSIDEMEFLK